MFEDPALSSTELRLFLLFEAAARVLVKLSQFSSGAPFSQDPAFIKHSFPLSRLLLILVVLITVSIFSPCFDFRASLTTLFVCPFFNPSLESADFKSATADDLFGRLVLRFDLADGDLSSLYSSFLIVNLVSEELLWPGWPFLRFGLVCFKSVSQCAPVEDEMSTLLCPGIPADCNLFDDGLFVLFLTLVSDSFLRDSALMVMQFWFWAHAPGIGWFGVLWMSADSEMVTLID